MRAISSVAVFFCVAAMVACSGCQQPTVTIHPDPGPQALPIPETVDYSVWDFVLSEVVHAEGVDYRRLAELRESLDWVLAMLCANNPRAHLERFGDEAQLTAYYINAYNAISLRAALEGWLAASPQAGPTLPKRFRGDVIVAAAGQKLDRRRILRRLEIIARSKPRIWFALCDGTVDTAPLARDAYQPEKLGEQLTSAAQRYLVEGRGFAVDHARRRLLLDELLYEHRSQLLAEYRRRFGTSGDVVTVLLQLAGPKQRQRLNRAVGYGCGLKKRTWRLNATENHN